MAHVHANAQPTGADAEQMRLPYLLNRKGQLVEIRPKGSLVIMTGPNATETRRRQHADAQKSQRDRMKVALGQIERIMRMGGAGTKGTKAELLETAVEYIQYLQKQVEELRELGYGGHATTEVDVQRCARCQD
ncbi:uncharacterized protein N7518_003560 [Penicillium psychrosexuale]|uniref:uncharacterized protein n=1 Tax=Penicillium psychrosexuale TaxID=1002107 RepID=UPI002544F4AD|nr:uncharacterized protein N7518_003560 [Penicillium psychrosexuale]KAJ5801492.1 hypothetical protein N7518_003560 [Penicillium psychrosexuale]